MTVGYMPVPADFKYLKVFLRGKPKHAKWDAFGLKHPSMERGHRAKIFSPFDALKGFDEAISSKDILYCDRPRLGEEEKGEINRRLNILYDLTRNSKLARANRVKVTVTYFIPCRDRENFAFGCRGQHVTVQGICKRVDASVTRTITVDDKLIPLRDILAIEAKNIFDNPWEYDAS